MHLIKLHRKETRSKTDRGNGNYYYNFFFNHFIICSHLLFIRRLEINTILILSIVSQRTVTSKTIFH